eukprot:2051449-Karenia_brevis.AAC.1
MVGGSKKKPAAKSDDSGAQLGLIRDDCPLCTAAFTCAVHSTAVHGSSDVQRKRRCSLCGKEGHRIDACPSRTKAIPKRGERGSSQPEEWSNAYSYTQSGQTPKGKGGN